MTRTFDVVGGQVVPDVSHLVTPEAVLARKRAIEGRLGVMRGRSDADPGEREALKLENVALDARLRELKEQAKAESARRRFAGIDTPIHEVLRERLDAATLAEIEREALERLAARERRNKKKA